MVGGRSIAFAAASVVLSSYVTAVAAQAPNDPLLPDLTCISQQGFHASLLDGDFSARESERDYVDIYLVRSDTLFFRWTDERRAIARGAFPSRLDEEMPDLDYRGTLVPAEGIRLFAQTGDPSVAEGNYHGAVWLFSDGWGAATRFYLRPDGEADASTFACVTR